MISYGRKIVADEKVVDKLGMLQAQILTQVDYWTDRTSNTYAGHKWVYNSINDWHKQFNWVALSTLKRAFTELEKKGLLITGNFNKVKYDRTKWYRVDYDKLDKLIIGNAEIVVTYPNAKKPANKPLVQNEPMDKAKMNQSQSVKMNQPIPKDYQEITHNINNSQISKSQSQSVNKTEQPTKSNKRYYEQFKKNQSVKPRYYYPKKTVEKATDWSKHVAEDCTADMDSIQQWFADFEAQTFGTAQPQV